jgi:hypothetical protein
MFDKEILSEVREARARATPHRPNQSHEFVSSLTGIDLAFHNAVQI